MKTKKLFAILLTIAMLLPMMQTIAFAETTLVFQANTTGISELSEGEEVEIPIKISSNPGFFAAKVYVTFDSNVFEFVNMVKGTELDGSYTINKNEYSCTYDREDTSEEETSMTTATPDVFFTLTLKVKSGAATGDTQISVRGEATDYNFVSVTVTETSSTITIAGAEEEAKAGYNNGEQYLTYAEAKADNYTLTAPGEGSYYFAGWFSGLENAAGITANEEGYYILSAGTASGTSFNITESRPKYDTAPAEDAVYHALWVYDDASAIRAFILGVVGNTVTFYSTTGDNTNIADNATTMLKNVLIAVGTTGYVKLLHDIVVAQINPDDGVNYYSIQLDMNGNKMTLTENIKLYKPSVIRSSYGKGEIVSNNTTGKSVIELSTRTENVSLKDLKIVAPEDSCCVEIKNYSSVSDLVRCELISNNASTLYLNGKTSVAVGTIDGCKITSNGSCAIRSRYGTYAIGTIDMIINSTITSTATDKSVIENLATMTFGVGNTVTGEYQLIDGGTVNFVVAEGTYSVSAGSSESVLGTTCTVTVPAGYAVREENHTLLFKASFVATYMNFDGNEILNTEALVAGEYPSGGFAPTYPVNGINTYRHLGWSETINGEIITDFTKYTSNCTFYAIREEVTLDAQVEVTDGTNTYKFVCLDDAFAAFNNGTIVDAEGTTVAFKLCADQTVSCTLFVKKASIILDLNGHVLTVACNGISVIEDRSEVAGRKIVFKSSVAGGKIYNTVSSGDLLSQKVKTDAIAPLADVYVENLEITDSGSGGFTMWNVITLMTDAQVDLSRLGALYYRFKNVNVLLTGMMDGVVNAQTSLPESATLYIVVENSTLKTTGISGNTISANASCSFVILDDASKLMSANNNPVNGPDVATAAGYKYGDLDGAGPETWYGLILNVPTVDGAEVTGSGKAPVINAESTEVTFTDSNLDERDSLTIATPDLSMQFSKDALTSIIGLNPENGALTFVGQTVTPGEKELHRISLELTANGAYIGFEGDVVVSFTFNNGEEGKEYAVYYVDENGAYEAVKSCAYDHATKTMTFIASHFSYYAVRETSGSYSAALDITETEVRAGGKTVNVTVNVTHSLDTVYNAGEFKVQFDSSLLTFDQAKSILPANAQCKVEGNTLTVAFFGNVITMPHEITLAFTTCASVDAETTATFTLIDAKFADSLDAVQESDLLDANVESASDTVTILFEAFDVTLNDTIGSGFIEAVKGEDYSFMIEKDPHYTYELLATVNGEVVTVTESPTEPGKYIIAGAVVTGPINITVVPTAKQYNVTFSGESVEANDGKTATHGTAYHFTLPTFAQHQVNYTITINGVAYTGATANGNVITIPGADITGDIVVNVTKTQTEFNVTLNGSDADWSSSNGDKTVEKDETITVTIIPVVGYAYDVAATQINGQELTITDNGDNTYAISGFTSDVTITVTKTLIGTVKVSEYIQLQNQKMFLITYTADLADNTVPYYDGTAMFWSAGYDAYCYLVVAEALTEETAFAAITVRAGDKVAQTIVYTYNVNGSTLTDAADAQLVYDMYRAMYQDFTTVSMKKFLLADVNGDKKVDTTDATAIISEILGISSEG